MDQKVSGKKLKLESNDSAMKTIYDKLGSETIEKVIEVFYSKAFEDPIISHFFVNQSKDDLIRKQQQFAKAMLGGPRLYEGKSLQEAHSKIPVKQAHFDRRQVLMSETLMELSIDPECARMWLEREEKLRALITGSN